VCFVNQKAYRHRIRLHCLSITQSPIRNQFCYLTLNLKCLSMCTCIPAELSCKYQWFKKNVAKWVTNKTTHHLTLSIISPHTVIIIVTAELSCKYPIVQKRIHLLFRRACENAFKMLMCPKKTLYHLTLTLKILASNYLTIHRNYLLSKP